MNISQENKDDHTAIIHINLGEEDYMEPVNKKLVEYRKKTNMPGFRPGKVPLGIIKKIYGKNILVEEVNKKVSDALNNYIVESKINVLGYPLPNREKNVTIDFDTQKSFDFYFDIAVAPEFEFALSEEIEVPYYKVKADKKDIDNAIDDIKLRYGSEEYPEKAEVTDGLQGTFIELDEKGDPVEGGIESKTYFMIEDLKSEEVKDMFIGKGVNDTVDFNPMSAFEDEAKVQSILNLKDEQNEKLSAVYRFTIEKVVRSQDAELNEELFSKVFPGEEIKTEEEFRERLARDLENHYAADSDRQFVNDAIDEFIKITDLPIPSEFMKRWLVESNEGKITNEQVEQQYESYEKSIRWSLIESKLIDTYGEQAEVTEENIRDEVRKYFISPGQEYQFNQKVEEVVDNILSSPEEKQRFYSSLQNKKLSALFKENISVKEKEVSPEEFIEIISKTKN